MAMDDWDEPASSRAGRVSKPSCRGASLRQRLRLGWDRALAIRASPPAGRILDRFWIQVLDTSQIAGYTPESACLSRPVRVLVILRLFVTGPGDPAR